MTIFAADDATYDAKGRLLIDTPTSTAGRGEIYLDDDGDADTDGSVRFRSTSSDPKVEIESRLNGVFNGAQVIVDDLLIQKSTATILFTKSNSSLVLRRTQR